MNIFKFNNREYEYLIHPYNNTQRNERKLEVPLAIEAYKQLCTLSNPIVEVGNVLQNYIDIDCRIIDLYEIADGVENINIFDAILVGENCISVSTIEHFGREEHGHKDLLGDEYPLLGLEKIIDECPYYFVTWGTGFNEQLDSWASEHQNICYLLKNFGGEWKQSYNQDDFCTPYAVHLGSAAAFVVATNMDGMK